MKRLLLLLLIVLLPLQMSWAASHVCDDEGLVAAAVAAAERGEHLHAKAADKRDRQAAQSADACCTAAHGCHGLHYLMTQSGTEFAPEGGAQAPVSVGAAPPVPGLLSRVERPKWPAA